MFDRKIIVCALILISVISASSLTANNLRAKGEGDLDMAVSREDKTKEVLKVPLKFTILYDNYVFKEETKADWGFSCLIEGTEKTILFDTGTRSQILLHNIDKLDVDVGRIKQIVISHNHGDHTGGLSTILDINHNVSVYLPISFPAEFVRSVQNKQAQVISVKEPVEICQNVFSTGEMGDRIKEQSLIINHQKGLIIVTGCSHQGIVNILEHAKKLFERPIYMVFGGFHLGGTPDEVVAEIVKTFQDLGVEKCGATHCTGDRAIAQFRKAFGENFLEMGTGKILEISE